MVFMIVFAVAAPLLTVALYFACLQMISPFWMIPIAFGIFAVLVLTVAVYLCATSLLFSKKQPDRPSRYHRFIATQALQFVLMFLQVRIKVRGRELLPKEPFILVSNHRSAMDALAAFQAFADRKLAFVAKMPVMKYPIVGPYLMHCCALGIERDKPLQSLRVINRAAKYVKEEKLSFGIYPEGTRTKTGRVGPFKSGAFLAAKKADAPVVVMTTEGTEKIWSRIPFRRPRITLTVRAVIAQETVRAETPEELAERARDIIVTALGEK